MGPVCKTGLWCSVSVGCKMPPRANLCSMLVELKRDIEQQKIDECVTKKDVCDVVDSRISQMAKQLISSPYCNNFKYSREWTVICKRED